MVKIMYVLRLKTKPNHKRYLKSVSNNWNLREAKTKLTDIAEKSMLFKKDRTGKEYIDRKGLYQFKTEKIRIKE